MKKYFWLTAGIVTFCMLAVIGAMGYLFSEGLQRLKILSEKQMLAAAGHCAEHLQEASAAGTDTVVDETINDWLDRFCQSTGFERITVCDTNLSPKWSSIGASGSDEDFTQFLIDQKLFEKAAEEGAWYFTPAVNIDGIHFKSLYYGCMVGSEPYVIVIDADQNYFDEAAGFGTTVFVIATGMFILTVLLLVAIALIDRRAQKALATAARHQRMAFLGKASAQLAHEIKNPLAIMKSSVDVLRMQFDQQRKEKTFIFLSEEIMRLSSLIENILSFSKEKICAKEPFSPGKILRDMQASFSQTFPQVVVAIDLPESFRSIGDSLAFYQIASNIMRNAAAAMEGKGTITIRGEQQTKGYFIYFHDTGPGIPSAIAKDIFEPFVSGSKTGTGLGLAIARSLCDAMGWEIQLVSHAKGLTTFALIIKEELWVKS